MQKKLKKKMEKNAGAIIIDLSRMMEKKKFSTFNDLRKDSQEFIKFYREQFVKIVLNKHGVKYEIGMSKREKQELFERYIVGIIKDEEKNYDKIYKEGSLIAYWNRNVDLFFGKKGHLLCKMQFKIF